MQQNRTQEQVLPTSNTLPYENANLQNEMDVELSPVCTQLHEDVTIDHVVPPIVAKGNTATASPDTQAKTST